MREIQQQIKNCEIKAHRQVATCQIPKCISCSENKGKKRSHKQHRGSITKDDNHPGSNTSIDHGDATNVPGTPGNTKDALRSRNTSISCSSLNTKHVWYIPHSNNLKPHLKLVAQNVIMRYSQNDTT
jgi:hypothetical protein